MYKVEKDWITKNGLRAVVIIGYHRDDEASGRRARCGYVGLPQGHVLYGHRYSKDHSALRRFADTAQIGQKSPIIILTAGVNAPEGERICASPETIFDVHGGITFSEGGVGTSYPVGSNLWWFGFDCSHYNDGYIDPYPDPRLSFGREYPARSLDFCIVQCENLAQQICELFSTTVLEKPIEG